MLKLNNFSTSSSPVPASAGNNAGAPAGSHNSMKASGAWSLVGPTGGGALARGKARQEQAAECGGAGAGRGAVAQEQAAEAAAQERVARHAGTAGGRAPGGAGGAGQGGGGAGEPWRRRKVAGRSALSEWRSRVAEHRRKGDGAPEAVAEVEEAGGAGGGGRRRRWV